MIRSLPPSAGPIGASPTSSSSPPSRWPSPPAAYASGSSMPWETTAQLDPGIGPRAGRKIISVIIITVTGLTLAFGDTSGGFRRLIQIVFGLSIAFAASSFFLSFFSFSGGALL